MKARVGVSGEDAEAVVRWVSARMAQADLEAMQVSLPEPFKGVTVSVANPGPEKRSLRRVPGGRNLACGGCGKMTTFVTFEQVEPKGSVGVFFCPSCGPRDACFVAEAAIEKALAEPESPGEPDRPEASAESVGPQTPEEWVTWVLGPNGPGRPLTRSEILALAPGRRLLPMRLALDDLVESGRVVRTGKGYEGDPYRYALAGLAETGPRLVGHFVCGKHGGRREVYDGVTLVRLDAECDRVEGTEPCLWRLEAKS